MSTLPSMDERPVEQTKPRHRGPSGRCPMLATDPITTMRPREDGWRCGHDETTIHGHTLYAADGEYSLYAGRWVFPADHYQPRHRADVAAESGAA